MCVSSMDLYLSGIGYFLHVGIMIYEIQRLSMTVIKLFSA